VLNKNFPNSKFLTGDVRPRGAWWQIWK